MERTDTSGSCPSDPASSGCLVVCNGFRRYSCEMRPLRYSINVTLDGCCDHRAIPADEDLHRHAVENLSPGRCPPLRPGDLRNDGGSVAAGVNWSGFATVLSEKSIALANRLARLEHARATYPGA